MGQVLSSVVNWLFGAYIKRNSSTPKLSEPLNSAPEKAIHVINIDDINDSIPLSEDEPAYDDDEEVDRFLTGSDFVAISLNGSSELNPNEEFTATNPRTNVALSLPIKDQQDGEESKSSSSSLSSIDDGFEEDKQFVTKISEKANYHVINVDDIIDSFPLGEDEQQGLLISPISSTDTSSDQEVDGFFTGSHFVAENLNGPFPIEECTASNTRTNIAALSLPIWDQEVWKELKSSSSIDDNDDDSEEEKQVVTISDVHDFSLPIKECVSQLKKRDLKIKPERWIKHYCRSHNILLVGEGDFSFSLCLAQAFGRADNMIATSLNPEGFLWANYKKAMSNINELKNRGCKVKHKVDATEMASYYYLNIVKFDRIVYNFPLAGFFPESRKDQLRRNKELVKLFLKNAKHMLSGTGEIHISHKSNGFFHEWNLQGLAKKNGLRLVEEVKFNLKDYPGYHTKYGFGGDKNFDCNPSKTYKFQLID